MKTAKTELTSSTTTGISRAGSALGTLIVRIIQVQVKGTRSPRFKSSSTLDRSPPCPQSRLRRQERSKIFRCGRFPESVLWPKSGSLQALPSLTPRAP
jgi:hypothetical protein